MDKLINPLSDISIWSGVIAEPAQFDEQRIAYHDSTALRFTPENTLAVCEIEVPPDNEHNYLAFNISTHSHPCLLTDNATYRFWIGDNYFTFPVSKNLVRVTLPIPCGGAIKLESLHKEKDFVVISDLRIINPGLPTDLLLGVKAGIERFIDPKHEVGQVNVKAGDREITFENKWEWLERNVVIRLGNHKYQIKNYVNNTATLGYTHDENIILEDFSGVAIIEIPVKIGYYDREAELPGIAIWYNAPTPVMRHAPYERFWCCENDQIMYLERNSTLETWQVSIEVVAHSPELVAEASRAVRAFLAEYTVWYQGDKLWFNWQDQTSDTEPVEGYDIVPRSLYQIDVEVEEYLWPERKVNPGTSNLSVHPSRFPLQSRIR